MRRLALWKPPRAGLPSSATGPQISTLRKPAIGESWGTARSTESPLMESSMGALYTQPLLRGELADEARRLAVGQAIGLVADLDPDPHRAGCPHVEVLPDDLD